MIPPGREVVAHPHAGQGPAPQIVSLAGPSQPPAAQPIEMAALFAAFRRRWALACFGGATLAALVGVVVFQLAPPPRHTARALVQVAAITPRVIFQTSEEPLNYRTYQQTQVALLKSRKVLGAALADPEVVKLRLAETHPDALGWLDKDLKAEFPGGSEVLAVTLSGSEPHQLPIVVNAVVSAYMAQIITKEREGRVARFDHLESLFQKMQDDLKVRRKALRNEVESVGLSDNQSMSTKQQLAMQFVGTARQELLALQNEIRRAEVEIQVLQAKSTRAPEADRAAPGEAPAAEDDPALAQMQARLAEKRQALARVKRITSDASDPSYKVVAAELRQLEAALEARRREVRAAAGRVRIEATRTGPLELARDRVELLRAQEKTLAAQIEAIGTEVRSNNVKYLDMHYLEEEINLTTQAARTVGTEVESLRVELQAPARVQPIESAVSPVVVDPMRKSKLTFGAAGSALCLFIGMVTFLEFQSRRVESSAEVVRALGLRPVGILPPARASRKRRSSEPDPRLVESVDEMRTMILHASQAESIRSVMVVGAGKGEGKTTVSCHLAASMARAGRRTLLIDCDLRNPSVHRVLDLADGTGVCEMLRGEVEAGRAIQPSGMHNLDLLLAGHIDPLSMQALAGGQFGPMLRGLEGRYDFVVIDSAPVLLVSDTLVVAQHADAVVFSILSQVSRMPMIRAACERLGSLGVRILGAVVVGEARKLPAYSYEYSGSRAEAMKGGRADGN